MDQETKLINYWWFWAFCCIILFTICMTIIITYVNSHPAIVRIEANGEVRDTISSMANLTDYNHRQYLEAKSDLDTCTYELDMEKSKLCGGVKEIDNMRRAMGEGELAGCSHGCEYYNQFDIGNNISQQNIEGCKSFCKSLASSYIG